MFCSEILWTTDETNNDSHLQHVVVRASTGASGTAFSQPLIADGSQLVAASLMEATAFNGNCGSNKYTVGE